MAACVTARALSMGGDRNQQNETLADIFGMPWPETATLVPCTYLSVAIPRNSKERHSLPAVRATQVPVSEVPSGAAEV